MKFYRKFIATLLVVTMTTTSVATVFAQESSKETSSVSNSTKSTKDNDATNDIVTDENTNEVTSLRTAYEKHFKLNDGSMRAVLYTDPIQYQDESGDWEEIDNSLKLEYDKTDETYIYTNSDNPFKVQFDTNPTNENETVQIDEVNNTISWSMQVV